MSFAHCLLMLQLAVLVVLALHVQLSMSQSVDVDCIAKKGEPVVCARFLVIMIKLY